MNGTAKKYDDKGNLTSEKNYLDGKLVGKQTQYMFSNRDNFIIYSNYSAKNKLDGDYTELYTDNKKTKVKGQYKEGLKAGKWLYYNTNGELEKEELYENGSLK